MKLIILAVCLFSTNAFGSVWKAKSFRKWNNKWEAKYSSWVARKVGPSFFKKLGGPYKDLKIDCADAHYGLKAYFARENGLPFSAGGGRTTHNTTRFDHLRNSDQKLAAFIKLLAHSYGTESLAHTDTYPVGFKGIRPGDLFMYKIKKPGKDPVRHAYIIKNINIDGTFHVLYSTQQRAANGRPLQSLASYEFKKAPLNKGVDKNHWGFRRYKKPQRMSTSQEKLRESDFSQYKIARSLVGKYGKQNGSLTFFAQVKKAKQTVAESPKNLISRKFSTLCTSVKNRVNLVNTGLAYAQKKRACLNAKEYDVHSTPSYDGDRKTEVRSYLYEYNQIKNKGLLKRVSKGHRLVSEALFAKKPSKSAEKEILRLCPVKTGRQVGTISLASFKRKLMADKVSFHPNDNAHRRWGIAKGRATHCKAYY